MISVRPKKIFEMCPNEPVMLDWPKAYSGVSILETCLLIAAARAVKARRYVEIGTYLGRTTLNLAMNSDVAARILTIDLPHPISKPDPEEVDCLNAHFAAGPMAFEGTPYASRIERLLVDSREWVYDGQANVDFVFIDGGHDVETLEADTLNAIRMLAPGGVIAWHDYGHPGFQPLTNWLDARARICWPLVHPEETLLAFYFEGKEF